LFGNSEAFDKSMRYGVVERAPFFLLFMSLGYKYVAVVTAAAVVVV